MCRGADAHRRRRRRRCGCSTPAWATATILSRLMRSAHSYFPNVPLLAVAKEISLEDVRLGLEKMPERFFEHPATVVVITNLSYVDALGLALPNPQRAAALNWQEVRLAGTASHDFSEQIEALAPMLAHGWETKPSPKTGNPIPSRPTVLVVYRQDHEFILDQVIPRPTKFVGKYDFALASQPWRASVDATFKAQKILAPLTRSLAPGGRLLAIQSWGRDPAAEIVERIWPDERPFPIDRHALLEALRLELGESVAQFDLSDPPDSEAVFRYHMHTLPSEIGDRIGTSTLFAAWNAVIYVNQIQDDRIEAVAHRFWLHGRDTGGLAQVWRPLVQRRGVRRRAGDGPLAVTALRHRLGEPGVFVIAAELVTSRGLERSGRKWPVRVRTCTRCRRPRRRLLDHGQPWWQSDVGARHRRCRPRVARMRGDYPPCDQGFESECARESSLEAGIRRISTMYSRCRVIIPSRVTAA